MESLHCKKDSDRGPFLPKYTLQVESRPSLLDKTLKPGSLPAHGPISHISQHLPIVDCSSCPKQGHIPPYCWYREIFGGIRECTSKSKRLQDYNRLRKFRIPSEVPQGVWPRPQRR